MRRASGRYYPDVFKGLRPCVRDVVPCCRWNVRQHLLRERHIAMSLDIGNATPVQYHQSFLVPRSRVPAYDLTREQAAQLAVQKDAEVTDLKKLSSGMQAAARDLQATEDRKSTRLNSSHL